VSLHAASPSELYASGLTIQNYTAVLGDSFYLRIIQRTLGTAAAVLALCLLIGYPVAYFVALLPPRSRLLSVRGRELLVATRDANDIEGIALYRY